MVYHSQKGGDPFVTVCGCPVLPLRGSVRGPAPNLDATADGGDATGREQAAASAAGDPDSEDIVDESLVLFRANVLFKSFPVARSV